jgi:hypothetical protein
MYTVYSYFHNLLSIWSTIVTIYIKRCHASFIVACIGPIWYQSHKKLNYNVFVFSETADHAKNTASDKLVDVIRTPDFSLKHISMWWSYRNTILDIFAYFFRGLSKATSSIRTVQRWILSFRFKSEKKNVFFYLKYSNIKANYISKYQRTYLKNICFPN